MNTETQTETTLTETQKRLRAEAHSFLKLSPAERIQKLEALCPKSRFTDRTALLAATFILGRAYRAAEPTARPLEERMGAYGAALFRARLAEAVAALMVLPMKLEKTIEDWMGVPEPEERRAKRLAHEAERESARKARWTANRELHEKNAAGAR